jgi:hypothetical protein
MALQQRETISTQKGLAWVCLLTIIIQRAVDPVGGPDITEFCQATALGWRCGVF